MKDEGAGVQCEQGTTKCGEDGGCWGPSGVREADWRQSWRMRRRHEDRRRMYMKDVSGMFMLKLWVKKRFLKAGRGRCIEP